MGTSLFSPTHLVILLLVALLLFGAKRLPEIGRSLGVGMREFKDSVTGITEATKIETRSELPPPVPSAPASASEAVAAAATAAVATPVPETSAAPAEAAPATAADPEREAEHVS